jgi:hypothetical protein
MTLAVRGFLPKGALDEPTRAQASERLIRLERDLSTIIKRYNLTTIEGPVISIAPMRQVSWCIDGGGAVITTGTKGSVPVAFAGTIRAWAMSAEPTSGGSIVVDVWKANGRVPTVADSIPGAEKPTLSSATFAANLSVSTWATAVRANDVFAFNVDSVATLTRVTLTVWIQG